MRERARHDMGTLEDPDAHASNLQQAANRLASPTAENADVLSQIALSDLCVLRG